MANEHDERLLVLAKSYDCQALADIFDEFHPLIYRYVARQVEDLETAGDLSADVFNRLLSTLEYWQGPDRSVRSWRYTCDHNMMVDPIVRTSSFDMATGTFEVPGRTRLAHLYP